MTPRSTDEREDIYKNYLLDLGRLIKEQARETKREKDCCAGAEKAFAEGKLMAYHEVISLMQQQAAAFGLSLHSIALQDINPETDLL